MLDTVLLRGCQAVCPDPLDRGVVVLNGARGRMRGVEVPGGCKARRGWMAPSTLSVKYI